MDAKRGALLMCKLIFSTKGGHYDVEMTLDGT